MVIPKWGTGATIGELYGSAMEVQTEEEAKAYLAALVEHHRSCFPKSPSTGMPLPIEEITEIELVNIGYWCGYHDQETAERVMRLFHTKHPILGTAEEMYSRTPEETFEIGKENLNLKVQAMIGTVKRLVGA